METPKYEEELGNIKKIMEMYRRELPALERPRSLEGFVLELAASVYEGVRREAEHTEDLRVACAPFEFLVTKALKTRQDFVEFLRLAADCVMTFRSAGWVAPTDIEIDDWSYLFLY